MSRSDRLFELVKLLRTGDLFTATNLAAKLGVTERTIYRDMDILKASGVPIAGERGSGYRATGAIALPPMSLTPKELEALNLGIAIIAEAADDELAKAAQSLGNKLDMALPIHAISDSESWKFEFHPYSQNARNLMHMATLRSAITARQKLRLQLVDQNGNRATHIVRPLQVENWGRVWTLITWNESIGDFHECRIDTLEDAKPMAELFGDEPGKSLSDFLTRKTT